MLQAIVRPPVGYRLHTGVEIRDAEGGINGGQVILLTIEQARELLGELTTAVDVITTAPCHQGCVGS